LRINVVHFCGDNDAVHGGGALSAAVQRDVMMPGAWDVRLRSPIHSIRLRGRPQWWSPIRSMTVLAI
jgi:hypothetical protein